jgi:tetratricopeptide (TPR) repeat protein
MLSLRPASLLRRQLGRCWFLGWAAGSFLLPAASSSAAPRARATPHPPSISISPAGAAVDHGIVADALPTALPAAPDLQLSPASERRAGALTAYADGVVAEDNADNEAALASYRKAFDLDPANAELAVKLAWLLAQHNDPTAGIEVLKDTVKAAPREPTPLIYLSQLYLRYLKKPEQALKYAEQALALDPNFYPSYSALFDLESNGSQKAKVEALLKQAAKASSTDPQFWLQIGGLWAQAYLKEDGAPANPAAAAQTDALFRKAAELGSNDALVQAKVGNHFIDAREVEQAVPYYRAALRLPQNSDDPILVNVALKLARALEATGQRKEAIAVLEHGVKVEPLRFEDYELLGELYESSGEYEKALENYKQSLMLDASEPRNHLRLADMQMRMKRFDDAVETARLARARFHDNPQTGYLLAMTLSQAKKHTEAMTAYAEALEDFRNGHEEFLTAQFYFSYGVAAEEAGLGEKAATLLKKSIELDPGSAAQAYNYLGFMWVDRGEHLEEALELEPDNGAFLDSSGWFYFKKGDYAKALQQLLKAADNTKPDDSVVFEHMGDTYQKLEKPALALQFWQKALTLDRENKTIADKIESAKQKVSANLKPGEK